MKPILLLLLLGCMSIASAQETGKPVDFDDPRVGDYIRVEGYLADWCSGRLRPDLAYQMDEALDSLPLLPNWKFQLEVHTDCRASHAYNDTLSQARADSLLAYYLMKGFPAWRITAKGMGERKLLMEKCSCELTDYNNRICEEKEHQLNRRVVIRLVGEIPKDHGMALNVKFPSVGQRKGFLISDETMDSVCSQIRLTLDSIPSASYSITLISQGGIMDRRRLIKQLRARIPHENLEWKTRSIICEFGEQRHDGVIVQIVSL